MFKEEENSKKHPFGKSNWLRFAPYDFEEKCEELFEPKNWKKKQIHSKERLESYKKYKDIANFNEEPIFFF